MLSLSGDTLDADDFGDESFFKDKTKGGDPEVPHQHFSSGSGSSSQT
jgi:hypothetical protein